MTYVFGIGHTRAKEILAAVEIDPDKRVHKLDEDEISRLRREIDESYKIEGDLRSEIQGNIKRLIEIGPGL